MSGMEQKGAVSVALPLVRFIEDRALPGTGLDAAAFWAGFSDLFERLAPANAALLAKRDRLQQQIDEWHAANPARPIDAAAYEAFLRSIFYLVEEPAPFRVDPTKVDAEVATMAGPQLVAPVLNARIRKRWVAGGMRVGLVGEAVDLTYPAAHLGHGPADFDKAADLWDAVQEYLRGY